MPFFQSLVAGVAVGQCVKQVVYYGCRAVGCDEADATEMSDHARISASQTAGVIVAVVTADPAGYAALTAITAGQIDEVSKR